MTVHSKPMPFSIFRARDAKPYPEHMMESEPLSPAAAEGAQNASIEGAADGSRIRLLFSMPGFSLTHVWFKSEFPLPRHSHNVDCLYYIVAGSLRLGTEDLGVGDGFFVGDGVPYAYTPGPEGVEVLEFRVADAFNIRLLANNPAFWAKARETIESRRDIWASETPPSSMLLGVP